MRSIPVLLAMTFFLTGCSTIRVTPITDKNSGSAGIRFYEPHPYLLVATAPEKDGKPATYSLEVIYLPNMSRSYRAEYRPGFGTFEGGIKLADGWRLTEYNVKSDTKIPETIAAVSGAVGEVLGAIAPFATIDVRPGLYRLDFDKKSGLCTGLTRIEFSFGSDTNTNK